MQILKQGPFTQNFAKQTKNFTKQKVDCDCIKTF